MHSAKHAGLGVGAVSLLAVVCCAGLPLLVSAGLSVALLTWVGGIAVGAIALAAAIVLLAFRTRRRSVAAGLSCSTPFVTSTEETANGARLLRARPGERRIHPYDG